MMPRETDAIRDHGLLPLDADTDTLLAQIAEEDDGLSEEERHTARALRAAAMDMHMAVGVGRRLLRTEARLRELSDEALRFMNEITMLSEPLELTRLELVSMLDAMALTRREAGLGNTFDVPGVGVWKTRKAAERWAIDNDAALAELEGDDRAEFVDPGEPRPPVPKVRGDLLRARLAELLEGSAASGIEDAAARERSRLETAERVAAQYPGVTFVPGEIRVTHDLNS